MMRRETVDILPSARLRELETALSVVIRGKPDVVRLTLVSLLSRGHLLLEDVPGVGKTTLAHALARSVDGSFHRLQFTADMLPSDVVGVTIYNSHSEEFEFKPGPVFTNLLVADEINRATPKTQSALLEAMNERQVTVDGHSYALPAPFMVVATQNPVEHHGTYPLPESQLDRFLMRLRMGYPDAASEREIILQRSSEGADAMRPCLTTEAILQAQTQAEQTGADDAVLDYLLAIVHRTRSHEQLTLGVSPRGAQALFRAAQSLAYIEGRDFVLPDDIKRLTLPVCAHRVMVQARTGLLSRSIEVAERVLQDILNHVEVPL